MSVVFGWYSFKLKSYSVKDLKLDTEEWGNSVFEVRQKVFHLFWIPFFSLGKFYVVRKQGKLYDLSEKIITIIKAKGTIRTPWYSFLLPILVVVIPILVGIYIYIAESIMKYNHYQNDKKLYETAIIDVQDKLQGLTKNAYLHIIKTNKPYDREIILLKVVDVKGDTYSFQPIKVNFPEYSNEKYYFENLGNKILNITKDKLEQAICKDYDIIHEKKIYGVNLLENNKYIIDKIDYLDEPVITGKIDWDFWKTDRGRDFYYNNNYRNNGSEITLSFQNFGIPADLVEIKNIENNINWTDSLPLHFDRYQYLKDVSIKGNTVKIDENFKFKSLFIFKDSLNRKSEFIVEGKKNFFTIKKKKTN